MDGIDSENRLPKGTNGDLLPRETEKLLSMAL